MNTFKNIKALTFDVFGTVVDWRSSIAREVSIMGAKKKFTLDWNSFADEWRNGYVPSMNKVRTGEIEWQNLDSLHRKILDNLLEKHNVKTLTEEEKEYLNKSWHRLDPWNDSVEGLTKLKKSFIITTLSNGNVSLLLNMAKYAHLPWDMILSAELVRRYKPDPETYMSASILLDIPINEIMMVAAHKKDLANAKSLGMLTAYVPRPLEHGSKTQSNLNPEEYIDITATDFVDLNNQLII
jgi:2-haloacid dehalogenase|tara:strand:- start:542 stop:1258 length:717 start_codon:yes stop_codon:yes gene_type:complete